MALPKGPSEQRFGLLRPRLTMNGKSNRPKSLTTLASDVVDAEKHLLRAAAQRGLLLHLVAELGGRELADLQLAAALGPRTSANFRTPRLIGWSVLLR